MKESEINNEVLGNECIVNDSPTAHQVNPANLKSDEYGLEEIHGCESGDSDFDSHPYDSQ